MKKPRQLPNLFQSVFETSWQAILIVDHQEIILKANRAACEFFAFAKAKLFGLKVTVLSPNIHYKNKGGRQLWFYKKIGSQAFINPQKKDISVNSTNGRIVYNTATTANYVAALLLPRNKQGINSSEVFYRLWAPDKVLANQSGVLKHKNSLFVALIYKI